MFPDDILIPPAREAQVWYCTKCGEAGGDVTDGYLLMDPRYAIGHCSCTKPRQNRVSGAKHEFVQLVADFAWDRDRWLQQQETVAERKAFEKMMAGTPVDQDERIQAMRHAAKLGIKS